MRAIATTLVVGAIVVLGALIWLGGGSPDSVHVSEGGNSEEIAPGPLEAPPSIEQDHLGTSRAADPGWTDATGSPPSESSEPIGEPVPVGPSVLVLDTAGNPVSGVPVLQIDALPAYGYARSLGVALTGEDGVATLSPPPASKGPGRAMLGFPHSPLVETVLPIDPSGSPPILRMPPTGSVAVRVLDEQGAAMDGVGVVRASLAGLVVSGPRGGFEATPDRGTAVFPNVGLSLLLDFQVRLDEFDDWMTRSGVSGPALAGERVEVVFRGVEQPVITGVLVGRSGTGLAHADIQISTQEEQDGSSSSRRRDVRTDEEGRFRILLREDWRSGATRWMRLTKGEGALAQYATVDLSRDLAGEVDLGVIAMAGASLICSGRVVDGYGAPVEGARLSVSFVNDCEVVSTAKSAVSTDATGRFEWFGTTSCEQLRLAAGKEGYFSPDREFIAVGESQVQITLTRGGSVSGSLRKVDDLPFRHLKLKLFRSEEGSNRGKSGRLKADGSFQFGALKAGAYTLEVSVATVLCSVENIVVPAGRDAKDPRLQSIELPASVRRIAIDVVDEHGNPRASNVSVTESDGRSRSAVNLGPGRFTYLTMSPKPLAILATAKGCRSATMTGVVSDQVRVTVWPGIPVKLIAAGSETIRDGERMLGLQLRGGSSDDFIWFDGQREALTTVSKPGEWRVEWLLRKGTGGGFTAGGIVDPTPQTIRVADSDSLQVFQVTPPPGAMDNSGKR